MLGWDDPRKIIPVCLIGQGDLIDWSYQRKLITTLPPEELGGNKTLTLENRREELFKRTEAFLRLRNEQIAAN
jgi:hypothetical protein